MSFLNQPQKSGCPILGAADRGPRRAHLLAGVVKRLRWECTNFPGQLLLLQLLFCLSSRRDPLLSLLLLVFLFPSARTVISTGTAHGLIVAAERRNPLLYPYPFQNRCRSVVVGVVVAPPQPTFHHPLQPRAFSKPSAQKESSPATPPPHRSD